MVIAVDFDGTIVKNAFPEIGDELPGAIDTLRRWQSEGDEIILWTCREEEYLENAVKWCEKRGLIFNRVNENTLKNIEFMGYDSRKIVADWYIDDKSVGSIVWWVLDNQRKER